MPAAYELDEEPLVEPPLPEETVSEYVVAVKLAVNVTALEGMKKAQGLLANPLAQEAPLIDQLENEYPDEGLADTETAAPAA